MTQHQNIRTKVDLLYCGDTQRSHIGTDNTKAKEIVTLLVGVRSKEEEEEERRKDSGPLQNQS